MHIDRLQYSVLILVFVSRVCSVRSNNLPYDTVVAFGDSDSDTGNAYKLANGAWPIPPYYNGRFCNGPLWVEKLTIPNLLDYAYGSATTDNNLVQGISDLNMTVPSVRQQINTYKTSANFSEINLSRTLHTIWVGGNDYFFNLSLSASAVVDSLVNGIKDLVAVGATDILIVNQPPLQMYPAVSNDHIDDFLRTLTAQHNGNLSNSIENLRKNFSKVSFRLYDLNSLITSIVANGSAFGITNITNCWSTSNGTIVVLCTDPNTYLYIDEYHFTTRVHQFIADGVRNLLPTSIGIMTSPFSIALYMIIYILLWEINFI